MEDLFEEANHSIQEWFYFIQKYKIIIPKPPVEKLLKNSYRNFLQEYILDVKEEYSDVSQEHYFPIDYLFLELRELPDLKFNQNFKLFSKIAVLGDYNYGYFILNFYLELKNIHRKIRIFDESFPLEDYINLKEGKIIYKNIIKKVLNNTFIWNKMMMNV